MTGPGQVARRLRARYAFGGATVELARTLPLGADEAVLLHGAVRMRGVGVLPRPAVLRLTPPRLVVLAHYALQPDRVWEVPRAAVREVRLDGRQVRLAVIGKDGDSTLTLTGWTGRAALDTALRDADEVADALRNWSA